MGHRVVAGVLSWYQVDVGVAMARRDAAVPRD